MQKDIEFSAVIELAHDYWGIAFDETKAKNWFRLLGSLNLTTLMFTLDSLAKSPPLTDAGVKDRYPPKPPQILDRYEELLRQQKSAERQRAIAEQQHLLTDQLKGQRYCFICDNSGDVSYADTEHNQYTRVCRCSCARGKDLSRWASENILKGSVQKNPKTGAIESLYQPDVNDVMTHEEIELIKAKNMARHENWGQLDKESIKLGVKKICAALS